MIFARKIYKIPEFYMIFARKMPEFYVVIARKIFFARILGGHVPPLPSLPPVSYAYGETEMQNNETTRVLRMYMQVVHWYSQPRARKLLHFQLRLEQHTDAPVASNRTQIRYIQYYKNQLYSTK